MLLNQWKNQLGLVLAVVLLFASCGPSRAELHDRFDRCIEYRVEPLWEKQNKIQALDDYLSFIDENETFTVYRFIDLMDLAGIRDLVWVDFEDRVIGSDFSESSDVSEYMNEFWEEARADALERGAYFFDPDELDDKRNVDEWSRFLWNEIGSKVSSESDAAYLDCDKTYAERYGKAYADRFS